MAQSLQFLTLSCRDVAEGTIQALTEDGLQTCRKRLAALKNSQQYELIGYATLELLKYFAPYKAIRTVYKELLQLLFWGYSLKDIWKTDEAESTTIFPVLRNLTFSWPKKMPLVFP